MEALASYVGIGMLVTGIGVVLLVIGVIFIFQTTTLEEEKLRFEVENQYRNQMNTMRFNPKDEGKQLDLADELNIQKRKKTQNIPESQSITDFDLERTERL